MFGWGRSSSSQNPYRLPLLSTGPTADTLSPLDDAQQAHQEVYQQDGGYDNPDNKAKFSHELLAGAASFEGFKLYEDHQRNEGAYFGRFISFYTPPQLVVRTTC